MCREFNRIGHITSANNHAETEQYPYIPQPGKTKLKCLLTVEVRCFVTYLTLTAPETPLETKYRTAWCRKNVLNGVTLVVISAGGKMTGESGKPRATPSVCSQHCPPTEKHVEVRTCLNNAKMFSVNCWLSNLTV